MAVTFVLGRCGAGKTHYCVDAVLRELVRPGEERLILLVPEQASFQMERTLATRSPTGGMWRAEVLSFTRLAQRVLDDVDPGNEVLDPRARALALRHVVTRQADSLRLVRSAVRGAGFYAQLDRLIEELLREGVQPDALHAAGARLCEAHSERWVSEIASLYAAYLAWLGPQRTDPAARLRLLREHLVSADWLHNAAVWVDGFAGFTGQELETLAGLAGVARAMTITLLVDPAAPAVRDRHQTPDPLGLFQRTERTYQSLLRLFEEGGVRVDKPVELRPAPLPRFSEAVGLAALEAGLAAPIAAAESEASTQAPPEVRVCAYSTHRDELRAAARWIREHVAGPAGGVRFRDFAVIVRDIEPLAHLVEEVFAEYEIPYFLDRRRPLRGHPLNQLLAAVFEAVASDFASGPMVRLLRTRLVPMSRDEAERLENVVARAAVRGVSFWRRARWQLEQPHEVDEQLDARRLALVAALEPLVSQVEGAGATDGAGWAVAVYDVLRALGVADALEAWIAEARAARQWESAELHRLAWESVCGLLEQVHTVLADTPLSAGELVGIVTSAAGEQTLGLAPPTLDQVLVSSIERSRHPDIRHAWVLAFNEGIFPARPPEDALLSTAQRDALRQAGLAAPASHREDAFGERLLAYIACTRASESLTISYATLGEDGEELPASPLLAEVRRVLPGVQITRGDDRAVPVSIAELARESLAVRQRGRRRGDYERLCAALRGDPAAARQLDWSLRGLAYRNEPSAVGNYRRPGGRSEVLWSASPSEIETFLQCPFKHFAAFGLWLDAQRGPRPLRWDLGSLAHELLADVTRRGMREAGGVCAVTDERWGELLGTAVARWRDRQPPGLAERRPDYVFMSELLTALLRDVVVAHAARWRRGEFEPLGCELELGPGGEQGVPGVLQFALPGGGLVAVRGKVDRVDVCRVGGEPLALVYDYKSRAERVGGRFLTGARLQLFLYLHAIVQKSGPSEGAQAGGVFLAPLYPAWQALGRKYFAEAGETERLMYLYRPRGLVVERAGRLLDAQLGTTPSPVAQLQLTGGGSFYKNSDVVSAAGLEAYLDLARRTVQAAAEGVAEGCIDVAPLVEQKALACKYCDFRAVCRFDRAFNAPRAAERALPLLAGDGGADDDGGVP